MYLLAIVQISRMRYWYFLFSLEWTAEIPSSPPIVLKASWSFTTLPGYSIETKLFFKFSILEPIGGDVGAVCVFPVVASVDIYNSVVAYYRSWLLQIEGRRVRSVLSILWMRNFHPTRNTRTAIPTFAYQNKLKIKSDLRKPFLAIAFGSAMTMAPSRNVSSIA